MGWLHLGIANNWFCAIQDEHTVFVGQLKDELEEEVTEAARAEAR